MKRKINPIRGWADVGSHGGIFVNMFTSCGNPEHQGRLSVYESKGDAIRAGVEHPIEVLIGNPRHTRK